MNLALCDALARELVCLCCCGGGGWAAGEGTAAADWPTLRQAPLQHQPEAAHDTLFLTSSATIS
ncbi:hypothetical protein E2C01_019469 [Portunus trituberculatus]|uniref:Secreted protein n=1 Tax=Portunus trituberculatus TaxID=210409 RepID=A0A5B7E0I2_PORTR|nr:hypothetical protein [Portunus trituberculatus]